MHEKKSKNSPLLAEQTRGGGRDTGQTKTHQIRVFSCLPLQAQRFWPEQPLQFLPQPQPRAGHADTVLLPGVAGSRHTGGLAGGAAVYLQHLSSIRGRGCRHDAGRQGGSTDPACRGGHKREPWAGPPLAVQPRCAWEEMPPPRAPSTLWLHAGAQPSAEPWSFLSAPQIHQGKLRGTQTYPSSSFGGKSVSTTIQKPTPWEAPHTPRIQPGFLGGATSSQKQGLKS